MSLDDSFVCSLPQSLSVVSDDVRGVSVRSAIRAVPPLLRLPASDKRSSIQTAARPGFDPPASSSQGSLSGALALSTFLRGMAWRSDAARPSCTRVRMRARVTPHGGTDCATAGFVELSFWNASRKLDALRHSEAIRCLALKVLMGQKRRIL